MPRQPADRRHLDSAPASPVDAVLEPLPIEQVAMVDALAAFHHPARRMLFELLSVSGPMNVGDLSRRSGLAPGSVSHHIKPLHRTGFVVPAPELARDTRESWWRAVPRTLTWSTDDYAAGTAARQIVDLAERANLEAQITAVTRWMAERRDGDDADSLSADSLVLATTEELRDISHRLAALIDEWSASCRSSRAAEPEAPRVPVRVIARAFPSDPGPRRRGPR